MEGFSFGLKLESLCTNKRKGLVAVVVVVEVVVVRGVVGVVAVV